MAEDTTTATPGEGGEDESGRFGRAKEYVNEQYTRASGAYAACQPSQRARQARSTSSR